MINSSYYEIKQKYESLCLAKSDINEHLPVLFKYATKCESVIECGVRRCVSSWALFYGLLNNEKSNKRLLLNDICECNVDELLSLKPDNIEIKTAWTSNLTMALDKDYDMVFIDTWHVYGQLKRELNKFGPVVKKYIIMHDTTIDEIHSESVRNKHDLQQKMSDYDFSYEDVTVGLGRAIDEFIIEHPEWKVIEKLTNNNGLTVLERVNS
jgi:hypothetical protein